MTVRRIMILLYGAGGVPGRGEIPMIQINWYFGFASHILSKKQQT